MPPIKQNETKERSNPYTHRHKPLKCREETCDRVPQTPIKAKTFRKNGRCRECAVKYGVSLIKDLVESDPNEDVDKLLSMAARTALDLPIKKLSDDKRRLYANVFRTIAFQIEAEITIDKSILRAFWRRKRTPKGHDAFENV